MNVDHLHKETDMATLQSAQRKRYRSGRSWPNLDYSSICLGDQQRNPQSLWFVSLPTFEPGAFRII